jgi:hypothetical protein|nr:hypothetical protein Q903MT_gene2333 [Picea sitchensis]
MTSLSALDYFPLPLTAKLFYSGITPYDWQLWGCITWIHEMDITLPLHTGGTTSPTSPIITTPDEWLNLAFLRW